MEADTPYTIKWSYLSPAHFAISNAHDIRLYEYNSSPAASERYRPRSVIAFVSILVPILDRTNTCGALSGQEARNGRSR